MTVPKVELKDYTRVPTERERQILQWIAEGCIDREIATLLDPPISHHTVRTHVPSMLRRIGAKTRGHAVAMGLRNGWIV